MKYTEVSLSVSQLNEYVRRSLASDPMLQQIVLNGEISNYKPHSSGHLYFTLKDDNASIACVMFRQSAMTLRFLPENGMSVRLYGSVGMYAKTGSYQFYAERMEQDGLGELYLRYEELKERLMEEGLFDSSLKKPLPLLPKGVGIITSSTGAVLHDICTVSWRRNPGMPLYLCPVKVQGAGAAQEIAAAIRQMDEMPEAEVLIVGRGGGSMEDLWSFNEECVARAIAACKTPVVSAVGHETDYSISDFVADVRAATPSQAAEFCVQPREGLLNSLYELTDSMEQALIRKMAQTELRLTEFVLRFEKNNPEKRFGNYAFMLDHLKRRLEGAADLQFTQKENRLLQIVSQLRSAGPEQSLRRGYALVLDGNELVRSVADVKTGQHLRVRLHDGTLDVRVESAERKDDNGSQKREENAVL